MCSESDMQKGHGHGQERYRLLFEHTLEPVLLHENGRIIDVNPAGVRLFGYSRRDDLAGRSLLDLVHSDYHGQVPLLARDLKEADPSAPNPELLLTGRKGNRIFVEAHSALIPYHQAEVIQVTMRDITERKAGAQARAETRQRFHSRGPERQAEGDAWLRLLAENGPDVVFHLRLHPEIRLEYVSPSVERVTGYSREEMLESPKLLAGIVHPRDRLLARNILRTGIAPDEAIRIRCVHRNGNSVWTEHHVTPVRDDAGALVALQGICQDVTQQVRDEKKLREREHFLDSVIENLPVTLFVKDAQELRFVRVNKAIEEQVGLSRTALIGKNDYDFFPKEVADAFQQADREVLQKRKLIEIEEEITTLRGAKRTLRTRKLPILDADGNPQYLLGISENITERKQFESQAQEANLKFQTLVEQAIAGVYVIQDYRFSYVNPRFAEVFGYTPDEVMALENIVDLVHEDDRALVAENIRKRTDGTIGEARYTFRGRRKDGSLVYVEAQGKTFTYEGKRAIVGILLDVSDRVAEERTRKQLLESLKLERTRLHTIFTHARAFICTLRGPEHIFEMVNPAFAAVIGDRDVIGRPLVEVMPELVEQGHIRILDRVLETSEPFVGTEEPVLVRKTPEGEAEMRYHNFVYHPLTEADGTVSGIFVHGMDVTDHVRARDQIEKAARANQLVMDHSLDVICTVNEGGHFVQMSAACERLWGYRPEELVGRSFMDFVIEEDLERTVEAAARISAGEVIHSFENYWKCKDGGTKHQTWSAAWSENDRLMFCVGRDLTESDLQKEQLRLLEAALNHASDGVMITESGPNPESYRIVYANPAFQDMMQYQEEEIIGKTPEFMTGPETDPGVLDQMFRQLGRGESFTGETVFRRKDGSRLVQECSVSPVLNGEGKPAYFVAIQRDITDRKQAEMELIAAKEQAETMNRLKDAFLSNMSHEIRTPLTSILGFAEVLKDEVSEEGQEFVGCIYESGRRLLDTLNSVLDLAQLQGRALKLHLEPLNVEQEIRDAMFLFQHRANALNLALQLDMSADSDTEIMADRAALGRVLNNLISNALKFTMRGGVTITVGGDAKEVRITVADTGIGINDDFLPHVFDEFRQESVGYARSHEGNGLGLAITKNLVSLMGAGITVQSKKGEGTAFTVTFPARTV